MRLTLVIALVLAGVAAVAAPAAAYPRFQLTTGASRCQECHVSPGGGGLLDDYGRLEAGDTISRGGDGALLHGRWSPPGWLVLGGDLRGAGLIKRRGDELEPAVFPMQVELAAAARGRGLTLYLAAGIRGGARDPQPPLVERLASREHYVMYERDAIYVRAGRFFPVFGIRSQDHTAYVRRFLGFGTLEEPYGLAAGWSGGPWEAHAHGYVPRPIAFLGAGPKDKGLAVMAERRLLEETAAIGLQARMTTSAADRRVLAGVVGKRWFERAGLLVLAEIDVQHQMVKSTESSRWQLASYLGVTQTLSRGLLLGGGLHRWQPDLGLRSSRDAFELDLQYFPRAHLEVHLLGRASAQGNDLDGPGFLSLLQLHYYL